MDSSVRRFYVPGKLIGFFVELGPLNVNTLELKIMRFLVAEREM